MQMSSAIWVEGMIGSFDLVSISSWTWFLYHSTENVFLPAKAGAEVHSGFIMSGTVPHITGTYSLFYLTMMTSPVDYRYNTRDPQAFVLHASESLRVIDGFTADWLLWSWICDLHYGNRTVTERFDRRSNILTCSRCISLFKD